MIVVIIVQKAITEFFSLSIVLFIIFIKVFPLYSPSGSTGIKRVYLSTQSHSPDFIPSLTGQHGAAAVGDASPAGESGFAVFAADVYTKNELTGQDEFHPDEFHPLSFPRRDCVIINILSFRASAARHGEVPFRVNPVVSASSGCRFS